MSLLPTGPRGPIQVNLCLATNFSNFSIFENSIWFLIFPPFEIVPLRIMKKPSLKLLISHCTVLEYALGQFDPVCILDQIYLTKQNSHFENISNNWCCEFRVKLTQCVNKKLKTLKFWNLWNNLITAMERLNCWLVAWGTSVTNLSPLVPE